jgi:hypothetical protein
VRPKRPRRDLCNDAKPRDARSTGYRRSAPRVQLRPLASSKPRWSPPQSAFRRFVRVLPYIESAAAVPQPSGSERSAMSANVRFAKARQAAQWVVSARPRSTIHRPLSAWRSIRTAGSVRSDSEQDTSISLSLGNSQSDKHAGYGSRPRHAARCVRGTLPTDRNGPATAVRRKMPPLRIASLELPRLRGATHA